MFRHPAPPRSRSQHHFTAICFDLDGVLINTMPLHVRAWQDALKPLGLRVSRQTIYEWEGEPGLVTVRRLLTPIQSRPVRTLLRTVLRAKERRFSQLARHAKINRRLAALLPRLSRRNMRLALVTGTSSKEVHQAIPHAIRSAFQVIVTSDDVRHGKPHPEPYRLALRQLRTSSQRAIVVENAPYGIRAARQARVGLVIALASSLPIRYLREAHLVVSSTRELCALLERYTSPR